MCGKCLLSKLCVIILMMHSKHGLNSKHNNNPSRESNTGKFCFLPLLLLLLLLPYPFGGMEAMLETMVPQKLDNSLAFAVH